MRLLLALATAALWSTAASAADCAAEIRQVMIDAVRAGPLHMESTIVSNGATTSMSGDLVPPGDMHMRIEEDGKQTEMIMFGDKVWMNEAGAWTELPAAVAAEMTGFMLKVDAAQLDGMTNAQCLGATEFGRRQLLAYSFELGDPGAAIATRVFADPVSKAPVHIESIITAPGVTTTMTADYTYDAGIKVTAPAL